MRSSINDTSTDRSKFIWNMIGSLASALSSLFFSVIVNRFLGGISGGIFAFAYSNAQLMYTIGSFEVRPFQSTDISEKYSFDTYFWLRIISCVMMIICSIIYVIINPFSFEKSMVVLSLSGYRVMDAMADFIGGRFQQKDRIDLSGKTYFYRIVFCTAAFSIAVLLSRSLIISCGVLFISSVVVFMLNEYHYWFAEDKYFFEFKWKNIICLVKDVTPLFIGAFIMMYISNAPKYAINGIYNDEIQNIYNILFMPAFVINLFSTFIFRPLLIRMAVIVEKKDYIGFLKIFGEMYIVIIGITLAAMLGSWFLGIPILSIIYGVNLTLYRNQLVMVMVCGGISALMTFSYYSITVIRKQKWLLIGYATAFIFAALITRLLVKRFGINGAILAYGASIGIIVVIFTATILTFVIKGRKKNG